MLGACKTQQAAMLLAPTLCHHTCPSSIHPWYWFMHPPHQRGTYSLHWKLHLTSVSFALAFHHPWGGCRMATPSSAAGSSWVCAHRIDGHVLVMSPPGTISSPPGRPRHGSLAACNHWVVYIFPAQFPTRVTPSLWFSCQVSHTLLSNPKPP